MQDALNGLFVNAVRKEEQKVNIGLRMNSAAAISANGEQRK